ncbi:MAG: hypothetical protein WB952_11845 [Terriglobales bacterium]
MKTAKFTLFRCVTALCPSTALTLTVLFLIVAATTTTGQTNVFVPGNASGCFGNPDDGCVPLVAALTVSEPGTITVTYVSGTVSWGQGDTGPNGTLCACTGMQFPLKEAHGIGLRGGSVKDLGALFGVFVPESRVLCKGFNALDGTKNVTRVGIMPNKLFFIGTGETFSVTEAGTLFLGINDTIVSDNSGGFNVTVTGP